jgi:hypothetical protein
MAGPTRTGTFSNASRTSGHSSPSPPPRPGRPATSSSTMRVSASSSASSRPSTNARCQISTASHRPQLCHPQDPGALDGGNVWGLNTAATMWCSAAVGACADVRRAAIPVRGRALPGLSTTDSQCIVGAGVPPHRWRGRPLSPGTMCRSMNRLVSSPRFSLP